MKISDEELVSYQMDGFYCRKWDFGRHFACCCCCCWAFSSYHVLLNDLIASPSRCMQIPWLWKDEQKRSASICLHDTLIRHCQRCANVQCAAIGMGFGRQPVPLVIRPHPSHKYYPLLLSFSSKRCSLLTQSPPCPSNSVNCGSCCWRSVGYVFFYCRGLNLLGPHVSMDISWK